MAPVRLVPARLAPVRLAPVHETEFSRNIATYVDAVIGSRALLLVTRQGSEALGLMTEGEDDRMQETLHRLSTQAHSDRLRTSLTQLRTEDVIERGPIS